MAHSRDACTAVTVTVTNVIFTTATAISVTVTTVTAAPPAVHVCGREPALPPPLRLLLDARGGLAHLQAPH